jgi:hypothetical protein
MRPEETDKLKSILWGSLSPQYSNKTLRLRTIIVHLFIIKVIPNRFNGVYQLPI